MVGIPLFVLTHHLPDAVPAVIRPTPSSPRASNAPSTKPGATDQGPAAGDRRAGQAHGAACDAGVTADRADLEAAADALLGCHLGGRQTDDALLAEILAAWVA
jgi:hypothetical protein